MKFITGLNEYYPGGDTVEDINTEHTLPTVCWTIKTVLKINIRVHKELTLNRRGVRLSKFDSCYVLKGEVTIKKRGYGGMGSQIKIWYAADHFYTVFLWVWRYVFK